MVSFRVADHPTIANLVAVDIPDTLLGDSLTIVIATSWIHC